MITQRDRSPRQSLASDPDLKAIVPSAKNKRKSEIFNKIYCIGKRNLD